MQVTYTTTVEDYVALTRYFLRKSKVARLLFLFTWLGLPAIGLIGAVILAVGEDDTEVAFCIGGGSLLFAALYPLARRKLIEWYVRANARQMGTRGALGRATLVLTDESLVEITETTRSEVRWEDVHGVGSTEDHTFIFVTGLSAAIVPRRGFSENTEYEAIREFLQTQVGQRMK